MSSPCPRCGRRVDAEARFCPDCGQALNAGDGAQHTTGPRLAVQEPGADLQEVQLKGAPVTIGRDPKVELVLGLRYVSSRHAQVVPHGAGYGVIDLESKNGTYLRGRRLPPNRVTSLQSGDVLRIGDPHGNSVSLTYLDPARAPAPDGTVVLDRDQLGRLSRYSIGRDPRSSLHLDSPVVSFHHAEIVRTGQGHEIVDIGSTNGTHVNGTRISRSPLRPGDVIGIGPFKLVFSPAGLQQYSMVGGVRLDGVKLRKEVQAQGKTKVLLQDISLSVLPREFVALVGGSGAGKSTLMDALNGSRSATGGRVLINGEDLYRNFDAYRANMGYVPQADIVHTGLTVRKALHYTARLRLPPDTSAAEVQRRVDDVLQLVELRPQLDVPIARLSGGQRKRVSIATELLSEPSLLFLDEPTSGLDPGLDKKMMRTLRDLADSGRTVVLTTHATGNILGNCNLVTFLAHGRLVYFGPPDRAMDHFQAPDFATIYGAVEAPQQAAREEARYRDSPEHRQYLAERQGTIRAPAQNPGAKGKGPGFRPGVMARQFFILSRRYLDLILSDKFSLFILLAVLPIIGGMLIIVGKARALVGDSTTRISELLGEKGHYNIAIDAEKLLLMLALSVVFLGLFASAYEIVKERAIYNRERMINLGILPYVASKVGVLMAFGLVQCAALLLVVSRRIELPESGVWLPGPLEMYATLVVSMLASLCMGLFMSALVKSSDSVIYIILIVVFVQIIFSGVIFELPEVARPIANLTPARFAVDGLGSIADMDGLNRLSQHAISEGPAAGARINTPLDFTLDYHHGASHLLRTWLTQLSFAVLYVVLTAVTLKRQDAR